ncbi:acyl carrier protein [Candidatus Binatia bacterium]|nr:acyl carrier protein [Candidatus Binatia bacterium]
MSDVLDETRTVLGQVLGIDPATILADSVLHELPNADSTAYLEAIVALEDHFDIELPDASIARFEVVGDLIAAIAAQTTPAAREGLAVEPLP